MLTSILFFVTVSVLFCLTISFVVILYIMKLQRLLKPPISITAAPPRPLREERPLIKYADKNLKIKCILGLVFSILLVYFGIDTTYHMVTTFGIDTIYHMVTTFYEHGVSEWQSWRLNTWVFASDIEIPLIPALASSLGCLVIGLIIASSSLFRWFRRQRIKPIVGIEKEPIQLPKTRIETQIRTPPSYTVEDREIQKMIPSARPPKPVKRMPPPTPKEKPLVTKVSGKLLPLSMLVRRGVLELKPTFTERGVRYAEAEEVWDIADPLLMKSTLESLEKEGTLESRFFDRVLTCPDCGSPEAYSKYACPRCDSYNVEYTELLEHTKCGHIASKGNFIKGPSLICPGCQYEILEEADYRVIGSCYQCEKCGYRFDEPEIVHFCQHCQRSFTHKEAKYTKIYEYKIADKIIDKIGRTLPLLETIGTILREEGFTTRFHDQITGASGVKHPFDIVAEKGEARIVVDLSVAGDKSDAVSLLGKKIDVHPAESLLIDLTNREELTSLGKVYGITVVRGKDKKKLEKDLRSLVTTL